MAVRKIISEKFLESQGFVIEITNIDSCKEAEMDGIVLQKRPDEEWTIAIEYDRDRSNEFILEYEDQIIGLIQILNKRR